MILAGLFTGLAAYTYLSARLFPIPVAFVLLIALFVNKNKNLLITNYFLLFISALLIFAPLGYFFSHTSRNFFVRYSQVIVKGRRWRSAMARHHGRTRHDLCIGRTLTTDSTFPLKPIFDPVVGFFFVVGLIKVISDQWSVISRWRFALRNPQSEISNQKSLISNLFLLIYTLTFFLPTALSVHDIFPSNVRAMGVMSVLTIFPAIGIVVIGNWVISKWRVRKESLFVVSLFIVHSSLFIVTFNDYFNIWAKAPSLHYANDTDLVNASRWLNAQDTRDTNIYFSAIHYRHPTVAYLARDYANIRWYFGGNALRYPRRQIALRLSTFRADDR